MFISVLYIDTNTNPNPNTSPNSTLTNPSHNLTNPSEMYRDWHDPLFLAIGRCQHKLRRREIEGHQLRSH